MSEKTIYSEVSMERIFYDPELPQKIMTPQEWCELHDVDLEGKNALIDYDDDSHDESIVILYEEGEMSIGGIKDVLGLKYPFVRHRLVTNDEEIRPSKSLPKQTN